jgi:hypothetical protein
MEGRNATYGVAGKQSSEDIVQYNENREDMSSINVCNKEVKALPPSAFSKINLPS